MATRSELRTRLQRRLGLGVVSLVEREKLNEAINSGIARAHSDGVPGLATTAFTGAVLGELAVSGVVVNKFNVQVTVSGSGGLVSQQVRPRDILVVNTDAGITRKFLVKAAVNESLLDVGSEPSEALTGNATSYIIRRSIHLPSTGQVIRVFPAEETRGEELTREPSIALSAPFKTGTPRFFDQQCANAASESCVSLWPAPTDVSKQWTVVQSEFKTRLTLDADVLEYPEEALDAIIERARMAYLTWSAVGVSGLSASSIAVRDTADNLKNSANPKQIFYKT